MLKKAPLILFYLLTLIVLSHCASNDDDPYVGWPADKLFSAGQQDLKNGYYKQATNRFESLESQYPFSKYAERGQRDLIYSQFKSDEHAMAVATADRFIKLYPRSQYIDYVYYIKGIANSEQELSFSDRIFPVDLSTRDTAPQLKAYEDFDTIVRRYPDSRYAKDASRRLVHLRDRFANNELHAARYYYDKHAYVGAINRCSYIIDKYPKTKGVEEALYITVKSRRLLGLHKSANDALKVLRLNYPKSKYLNKLA